MLSLAVRCGVRAAGFTRASVARQPRAAAGGGPRPARRAAAQLYRCSAGPSRRRPLVCAAAGDDNAVPDAVANAITGSTPEDVEALDDILSAGGWDDVQATVRNMAMEGRVTPGVLSAAEKVLGKMSERGDADLDVVKSVSAVVDLLKATLDALSKLAPKAKLAESLTGLDPNIPSERALMQELMDLAFAETGSVDRIDFLEDMVYFVKSSDERDAGFLAAVAEGQVDLGEMKLEDVMLVRRQGRERMQQIVDMCYGYGTPGEAQK